MFSRMMTVGLFALLASGCVSWFHEIHYFKSETSSASAIPNYYKLEVKGYTMLSSSRYVSGYFDEDTLDTYFNEFSQASKDSIIRRQTSSDSKATSGSRNTSKIEPVDQGLQNKKLIMILSSNSDDVTTQIGALAASKQFTASLAGLVSLDQYKAAQAAENRLLLEKTRAKATSDLAGQIIDKLDNASAAEAQIILCDFINVLASDLGAETAFANVADAKQWLRYNRSRLLRRDQ